MTKITNEEFIDSAYRAAKDALLCGLPEDIKHIVDTITKKKAE